MFDRFSWGTLPHNFRPLVFCHMVYMYSHQVITTVYCFSLLDYIGKNLAFIVQYSFSEGFLNLNIFLYNIYLWEVQLFGFMVCWWSTVLIWCSQKKNLFTSFPSVKHSIHEIQDVTDMKKTLCVLCSMSILCSLHLKWKCLEIVVSKHLLREVFTSEI